MADLLYIVKDPETGRFSRKLALATALNRVDNQLPAANSFRWERLGSHENSRRFRNYDRFEASLKQELDTAEEGDIIRTMGGGVIVPVRAVWRVQPTNAPSCAVPKIRALWDWTYGHHPAAHSAGVCVCKRILGSNEWSAHASGRAMDVVASVREMQIIVREWVQNAQQFGLVTVIHRGKVWSPTEGWHTYTGADQHYGHIHGNVQYDPYKTPACAA